MKTTYNKLNDTNQNDYGNKSNGEFRRQLDQDIIHDHLSNINWEVEANYHNMYLINGKYNKGRTITLSKNGRS